jgi:ketosteroid isomerase-like protein
MSEENVERLRDGYAAMARRDLDAILPLLAPDVELHDRPEAPDARSYQGHEGAVTALDLSLDAFADFTLVPERFYDGGDRIVVVLKMEGTGRVSGAPVEDRIAHFWTLRDDGLATALRVFSDPADALEAAGISEAAEPDRV